MTGEGRPRRLLLTTDAVGGVWQYSIELARALVANGYQTVLALMGPSPDEDRRAAEDAAGVTLVDTGLDLDWLAPDPLTVHRAGYRLAEMAGDVGADVVQLNTPALAADARFPAPVVAVAHSCVATWWEATVGGDLSADFVWRKRLASQGLHAADRTVAPSVAFAEVIRLTYRLAERPAVVLNGRTPLPLPRAAMHDFAFTAGRLWDKGKDLATLDRAAALLGIPFKAAGSAVGPHGEAVHFEHLVSIGSLNENKLGGCLAARPVFVSAARYEPFGLAVLEAAAAGCPLVLADIPTFRELWEGVALFVAPGDARGFARAIEDIIGNTNHRQTLGELARGRAKQFSPQAMAAGMAEIYRSIERPNARAAA